MKKLVVWLAFCLLPAPALADAAAPIQYARGSVVIERASPPAPTPLPWQKADELRPTQQLPLEVEIRDAAMLYRKDGWFNLRAPSDNAGVLLLFASPTLAAIPPYTQQAPLDILMVDKEGIIRQIAPSLVLSDLSEEIYPQEPVLAFLFLRGGLCERSGIRPGDRVLHTAFKKPPAILSAPPAPQPVASGR
jgi:uncharacterized membrane protein (UPF0127 family)